MRCPRCHRRYDEDSRFCSLHGEPLVEFVDLDRLHFQKCEQVGQIVGDRYRIHGSLGRGAMATVFLARDLVSGEAVAVKVLDRRHAGDKRTAARMLLEAKAIASISHENVIEVLDVGLLGGLPYLVMEYLFGESLGDALRRDTALGVDRGLPLVREIASGLAAAHRVGIIHRDVKPDNVFLLGDKGDPYGAKVVDFGFAKVADQRGMTHAGVTVGTIEYMAPEQAVGDPPDAAADIYALGIVMYRLFSGRLPFIGTDSVDVLAKHLASPLPPLHLGARRVDRGVTAIIAKAVRKDPSNRYPTMYHLIDDIDRLGTWQGPSAASERFDQPDVYVPKSPFATHMVGLLYRRLGMPPPAP